MGRPASFGGQFCGIPQHCKFFWKHPNILILSTGLQLFGPYAAMKLAEMSEGLVLDCLSQLDSCLSRWKELLDPVTMAVVVSVLVTRTKAAMIAGGLYAGQYAGLCMYCGGSRHCQHSSQATCQVIVECTGPDGFAVLHMEQSAYGSTPAEQLLVCLCKVECTMSCLFTCPAA